MIKKQTFKKALERIIKIALIELGVFIVAVPAEQLLKPKNWILPAVVALIAGLQKGISGYLNYDRKE
jgi:hypothetical protein